MTVLFRVTLGLLLADLFLCLYILRDSYDADNTFKIWFTFDIIVIVILLIAKFYHPLCGVVIALLLSRFVYITKNSIYGIIQTLNEKENHDTPYRISRELAIGIDVAIFLYTALYCILAVILVALSWKKYNDK